MGECWLQSARVARKAGHHQTAYNALLNAGESKLSELYVERAKWLWSKVRKLNRIKPAVMTLGLDPSLSVGEAGDSEKVRELPSRPAPDGYNTPEVHTQVCCASGPQWFWCHRLTPAQKLTVSSTPSEPLTAKADWSSFKMKHLLFPEMEPAAEMQLHPYLRFSRGWLLLKQRSSSVTEASPSYSWRQSLKARVYSSVHNCVEETEHFIERCTTWK